MLICDIFCQWVVHYQDQFGFGDFLHLPDFDIIGAVGKFHLGAHVLQRFWKFSLNFIVGAGQVDGEVLEILWSELDKVAGFVKLHCILLPSSFNPAELCANGLGQLLHQEKELREGQMHDALHCLCQSLGDKAWLLRSKLWNVKGTKKRIAIRRSVADKGHEVDKHVSAYNKGRDALQRMGFENDWRPITKNELRLSSDVAEANQVGQNCDKLPWFWRIEEGEGTGNSEIELSKRMEECVFCLFSGPGACLMK